MKHFVIALHKQETQVITKRIGTFVCDCFEQNKRI